MIRNLADIEASLAAGTLLAPSTFEGIDPDELLDRREEGDFEDDWIRAAEDVQAEWEDSATARIHQTDIDGIRELVFKTTYNATQNAELAATVSDDFELIGKASAMALESPYIGQMLKTYEAGGIPG